MGKITDEELQIVTKLKDETTEIISNLGQLEYQKISIDFAVQQLKLRITELKDREAKILGDLRQKYGNVAINIETGEF